MMMGEGSLSPNSSTDWSRVGAPASTVGHELHCGERRLVVAHGDLVAGGAVDHVEQHARQLPAREFAHRRDAVAFALERGLIHQASSR